MQEWTDGPVRNGQTDIGAGMMERRSGIKQSKIEDKVG